LVVEAKNRPAPTTVPSKTASATQPPKPGAVTFTKAEPVPTEVDYALAPAPAQGSGASEGVTVARFNKPPVQKTVLKDGREITAEISKLESGGPVRTTKYAVVKSDEDQAVDADQKVVRGPVSRVKANDAPVNAEPMSKTAANGATGDVSEARSGGEDLTDLLPDAASSGVPSPSKLEWPTTGHWRNRVKTAVDKYARDPAALKQIYAAETETVVKYIKAELARK
jgi:hypothetical protein